MTKLSSGYCPQHAFSPLCVARPSFATICYRAYIFIKPTMLTLLQETLLHICMSTMKALCLDLAGNLTQGLTCTTSRQSPSSLAYSASSVAETPTCKIRRVWAYQHRHTWWSHWQVFSRLEQCLTVPMASRNTPVSGSTQPKLQAKQQG